jgi:hypothetical protein
MKLIGNPQRAKKLRTMLNRLPAATMETVLVGDRDGLPVAYLHQRKPGMCPTRLLYGEKESQQFYLDPSLRQALDAWDNGSITAKDLRGLCNYIENRGEVK